MRETDTPSLPGELDLALVHALQLRPRASWTELAPPLGVTAGTLARRWERLRASGLAWVSATPGTGYSRSRCTGFVLLRCRPNAVSGLAMELAHWPQVATIELVSGGGNLLLDVLTPDFPTLGRLLTDELPQLADVREVLCMFATSLAVDGSRWQLSSLDPAQRTELHASGRSSRCGPEFVMDSVDRTLLNALVHDGRLTWVELAQRADTSTATARRRLRRLESAGIVAFRCDVAPSLAGRPVPVSFTANVPAADVATVHRVLAQFPECRLAAAVTGPANILTTFWVHDLAEVHQLERALSARLPSFTVTDRILGLRTVKRMGHLLDSEGRNTGVRHFCPW